MRPTRQCIVYAQPPVISVVQLEPAPEEADPCIPQAGKLDSFRPSLTFCSQLLPVEQLLKRTRGIHGL